MKKELREVYICEYCGCIMLSEEGMLTHELICLKNPINQPCSECENQIIGLGCSAGIDMESIGGKVACFKYMKGKPKSIQEVLNRDK